MSLYDTLRKSLTPELFTQVTDALGDDFDYDVVPRSRLNKVIKQRNELRDQLAGGTQPKGGSGKKGAGEDDDDDDEGTLPGKGGKVVDEEALRKQYQKAQDDAVKAVKIQYAALDKLRAANAIDPELIWSSNALDKTKIDLDDNGNLTGLDDMLTELQKNKAHLFKVEGGKPDKGTGKNEGGDDGKGGTVSTLEDFMKLPYDKQIEFKKANPEVFKSFMG